MRGLLWKRGAKRTARLFPFYEFDLVDCPRDSFVESIDLVEKFPDASSLLSLYLIPFPFVKMFFRHFSISPYTGSATNVAP